MSVTRHARCMFLRWRCSGIDTLRKPSRGALATRAGKLPHYRKKTWHTHTIPLRLGASNFPGAQTELGLYQATGQRALRAAATPL